MQQLNEIAILDKWRLETDRGKTNLPQDVYTQICELDPTTKNGNAGKYCDWLLRRVTPDMLRDTDKLRRLRIVLEQFNDGKKRGILQRYGIPMDIGQYKTVDELINTISGIMSQGTAVSQSTANKMGQLKGQYDIVGEDKDWIVVHPKTFEAERYFGSGTEWCTVANEGYFKQYSKQGPLYITFPKNGNNKLKMQFHFESESFADYQDEVYGNPKVCIVKVLQEDKNRIKPLFNLWSKISPDFNDYQYMFFDEVQDLLDSGKRPEEVFDEVGDFSDGYAKVKLNGKYNFIDTEGNILSQQWFDYVRVFHDGYAKVWLNGKWNFIDTENKLLSPNQWFDYVDDFEEGYAAVRLKRKWNFIDTKGKIRFNQWYEGVGDFHNGYARVELNGKWNFIDTEGKVLSPQWYEVVDDFHNGYAAVKLNGKWNFIDTEANILYPEHDPNKWFDWILDFSEGYASVELNGKFNFIDTKGNIQFNQWYDYVDVFHEGYANVRLNGEWKYLDTNGRLYDYNPRRQNNVLTEAKLRKIIRKCLLEAYDTIYKETAAKW